MPPKTRTWTLKNLQTQCEAKDLDTMGTMDELRERLDNWERTRLIAGPPLPTPESLLGDGVQDMDIRGDGSLEQVRDETVEGEENVLVQKEKDCEGGNSTDLSVGNGMTSRLGTLNQAMDSNMSRLALLEERIIALGKRNTLQQEKMNSLQDLIDGVIPSVEPYLAMRSCLISMFKRDKLGNATERDLEIIAEGPLSAQGFGGDAVTDAQLYNKPGRHNRSDWYVFEQLYGLPAPVVEQITHRETITVLNCHAAVLASSTRRGTEIFYTKFLTFIDLFKKSNYDLSYLEGSPTFVTDAYQAFMKGVKGEVTGIEIVD